MALKAFSSGRLNPSIMGVLLRNVQLILLQKSTVAHIIPCIYLSSRLCRCTGIFSICEMPKKEEFHSVLLKTDRFTMKSCRLLSSSPPSRLTAVVVLVSFITASANYRSFNFTSHRLSDIAFFRQQRPFQAAQQFSSQKAQKTHSQHYAETLWTAEQTRRRV